MSRTCKRLRIRLVSLDADNRGRAGPAVPLLLEFHMKKLALKLDDLSVDSFHASSPSQPSLRGTVMAQENISFDPCMDTGHSCMSWCLPMPTYGNA